MRFLTRMLVLFYVTLMLYLSCFLFAYAMHWLRYSDVKFFLEFAYLDENLRYGCMVTAGVLLVINYIFYQVFSVNVHKEKIIAFDNPSGRVTVSLMALEDIINKMLTTFREVKKSNTAITAVQKGLDVKIKLTLQEEINIPEATLYIQNEVKHKLQDIIGIVGPIDIKIYVNKILADIPNDKDKKNFPEKEKMPLNIPFHGLRG